MSSSTRPTKLVQAKGKYFVKVFFSMFPEVFTIHEGRGRYSS
jgi:hypothetical protein